jgi:hypothetical protein
VGDKCPMLQARRPPGSTNSSVRWLKRAVLALLVAYAVFTLAFNWLTSAPVRVDPIERRSGEPVVDAHLEIARKYAPQIYNEVDAEGGRQDLPAPVDFDGNLDGEDNWENFPYCELVPTVSYAHLETATHRFLTYHIFHPRDWEPFELPGLHLTHEGDGENLQVVVEKASGRVVLLFTQAHYRGKAYVSPGTPGESRERFWLADEDGRIGDSGTHPAIFVEAKGHGIYGIGNNDSRVRVEGSEGRFERRGLVLRPARIGEHVGEPSLDSPNPIPYQLESTAAKMWPGVKSGALIGRGRLLDGVIPYEDARVSVELPKFHRGNRFSGPFGPSRGISPFAVDFGWSAGALGSLFFDPARRYAEVLGPNGWAREYVDYPFSTR